MQSKFDTQAYINKLEFCPVHETTDKSNKLISSVKLPVSAAVESIASSAREICAAAVQSLDFSKPVSVDTELLDSAISCLEAVLNQSASTPKPENGALNSDHRSELVRQIDKLKALRSLDGLSDLKSAVLSNPGVFRGLRQDLFKMTLQVQLLHGKNDKYEQLVSAVAAFASVLSDDTAVPSVDAKADVSPAQPALSKPTAKLAAKVIADLQASYAQFNQAVETYKAGPTQTLVKPEVLNALGRQFNDYAERVMRVYGDQQFKSGE
ncbi:MAG TPA: hypothetical protein VFX23_06375 [Limnobacter sp.]|uniref:hypothetical protein n=1 Tax=Limnobacter sp. TaxID=2003368 RepID=UPI002E30CAA5|nr:hypothetical protein [Limnobacter sp.]HEX5485604.1 hypothetical protein [Limnobacter sp.]